MKCCICGKEFEGFGNNPYPVGSDVYSDEDRCCDECNWKYVIPARLARLEPAPAREYKLDVASFKERDSLKVGDNVLVLVNHEIRKATITRVAPASDDEIFYFGGYNFLEAKVDGVGTLAINEFIIYK